MSGQTINTNQRPLESLLDKLDTGEIQLPDFQRGWVWDEDRIISLIASVARSFPIGALMTLRTGGEVEFMSRPIEGAEVDNKNTITDELILDGQQRMTSLYQVTKRGKVVETVTSKHRKVSRWFYFDISKALNNISTLEDAIISVPKNGIEYTDFGRTVSLDLSCEENEYKNLMFPIKNVFDWDSWQDGFDFYWSEKRDKTGDNKTMFRNFKKKILANFRDYQVPVILLDRSISKEAICTVFEKVNTGGKALDAFELVTAMYAKSGFELRKEWFGDKEHGSIGIQQELRGMLSNNAADDGVLEGVSNTDFLQAISLFYTKERKTETKKSKSRGGDVVMVSGRRQALLDLPLEAYKKYAEKVKEGFFSAAKFLHELHIYRVSDIPYQSQVIALATILAHLGRKKDTTAVRKKLIRWYWNGVFGELYGSSSETRIARDCVEVIEWMNGGSEPSTISDANFLPNRLDSMRTRLSAAYKGVNALLMAEGARDFLSHKKFQHAILFDERVDIHHIFPKSWCEKNGIDRNIYNSVINKTPLSSRTNRAIGGNAPSVYIKTLEKETAENEVNKILTSHVINPKFIRNDNFSEFFNDRKLKILKLIEEAMGKSSICDNSDSDEEYIDDEEEI